mgnify:CR=1 FL=1
MPVITRSQVAAFRSALKQFHPAVYNLRKDADFVKQFKISLTAARSLEEWHCAVPVNGEDIEFFKTLDYLTDEVTEYYIDIIINIYGAGKDAADCIEAQFKAMLRASGRTPLYRKGRVLIEGPYNAPVLKQEKVFLWSGIRKEQEALAADLHLEWDPYM